MKSSWWDCGNQIHTDLIAVHLERVHFAKDSSEADQDCRSDDATLGDIDESELDDKLFIKLCKAKHDDCKLCHNNGHNHGESQGGHPVALQESHQKAETTEEHYEDIRGKGICSEVVSEAS